MTLNIAKFAQKHPKLLSIAFTAVLLSSQFLVEYDINSGADAHPGP